MLQTTKKPVPGTQLENKQRKWLFVFKGFNFN